MFPVVGNTYISKCDDVKCGLKEKKKVFYTHERNKSCVGDMRIGRHTLTKDPIV